MPDSAREPAGGSCSRAPPGSQGSRDGQGLERRGAVNEVVRSEVTRSLVTMFRGSTTRPADRRGRARRSSLRHRRDDSSSSSTTDVSRSGDESAFAALLGAVRATLTPSTVRKGTWGTDPRTLPTTDSVGGEQGGGAARVLPRGIDPGFPTQLSLATGTEAEGWPTQAGPFRIRVFQQNLGYIQIYPDTSVGIFSQSNVRAKRKTLLESSPHAQALRGRTDEHKMLLRAGCHCLQNGALSESLFQSPWTQATPTPPTRVVPPKIVVNHP